MCPGVLQGLGIWLQKSGYFLGSPLVELGETACVVLFPETLTRFSSLSGSSNGEEGLMRCVGPGWERSGSPPFPIAPPCRPWRGTDYRVRDRDQKVRPPSLAGALDVCKEAKVQPIDRHRTFLRPRREQVAEQRPLHPVEGGVGPLLHSLLLSFDFIITLIKHPYHL